MRLTIEKHPDFSRLVHCFQKIELLAHDLGLNVDDFLKDEPHIESPFENASDTQSEFSKYRAKIYRDSAWDVIR